MKKFVFVYFGKVMHTEMNPEDMKVMMDTWMAWFGTFKDQMVDGGNPFSPSAMSVKASGITAMPEGVIGATGYTIINAADMDEATKIAKGCPVLAEADGEVKVFEAMPM